MSKWFIFIKKLSSTCSKLTILGLVLSISAAHAAFEFAGFGDHVSLRQPVTEPIFLVVHHQKFANSLFKLKIDDHSESFKLTKLEKNKSRETLVGNGKFEREDADESNVAIQQLSHFLGFETFTVPLVFKMTSGSSLKEFTLFETMMMDGSVELAFDTPLKVQALPEDGLSEQNAWSDGRYFDWFEGAVSLAIPTRAIGADGQSYEISVILAASESQAWKLLEHFAKGAGATDSAQCVRYLSNTNANKK